VNWTWNIRSRDGGMNGLEFARATTAGGLRRVLVHAAPAEMSVEVRTDDDDIVARGDTDRESDYSPMTQIELDGDAVRRSEVWPGAEHVGLPVFLAGGEVGVLKEWEHAEDHSWWRWQVEFSNHKGRPADWSPDAEQVASGVS
jgi:hypothetical protein